MTKKNRLDVHLLTKGFASSREQAQKLIRAGKVSDMDGQILDKPGQEVSKELLVLVKSSPRFVSRGGEKLDAALDEFPIIVSQRVCIDAGVSTGGFTDCLLKRGASLVYGVDVGYGQIAWSLRNDPRVVLKERTNIRHLTSSDLYSSQDSLPSLAVVDLSFISLKLVLSAIKSLLSEEGKEAVLLVKPQFEVGRGLVGKRGVVRDVTAHISVLNMIMDFSKVDGWKIKGLIPSPITGPAGNHEYLLWIGTDGMEKEIDVKSIVKNTLQLKC